MKTIWKYTIEITDQQKIIIPAGSKPIHVGLDPKGSPCLWAIVNPDNRNEGLVIYIYSTGHSFKQLNEEKDYIGSFNQGTCVWHVFK